MRAKKNVQAPVSPSPAEALPEAAESLMCSGPSKNLRVCHCHAFHEGRQRLLGIDVWHVPFRRGHEEKRTHHPGAGTNENANFSLSRRIWHTIGTHSRWSILGSCLTAQSCLDLLPLDWRRHIKLGWSFRDADKTYKLELGRLLALQRNLWSRHVDRGWSTPRNQTRHIQS